MTDAVLAPFAARGITELELHDDPDAAVERIARIYDDATARLKEALHRFAKGERPTAPIASFYPFVGVQVDPGELNLDARLSYGVLHEPGIYGTTLTRPKLFGDYYRTQLGIVLSNHRVPIVTGVSRRRIPLPFVVEEMTAEIPPERVHEMQYLFPMPDLSRTDY
jgi:AMP nucleosidase